MIEFGKFNSLIPIIEHFIAEGSTVVTVFQ